MESDSFLERSKEDKRGRPVVSTDDWSKPVCLLINRFLQVAAGAIWTDVFRQYYPVSMLSSLRSIERRLNCFSLYLPATARIISRTYLLFTGIQWTTTFIWEILIKLISWKRQWTRHLSLEIRLDVLLGCLQIYIINVNQVNQLINRIIPQSHGSRSRTF